MLHVRELSGDDQSVVTDHSTAGCLHSLLSIVGEWNVRCACVLAGEGPFGLAVPDDEAAGCCDCHLAFLSTRMKAHNILVSEPRKYYRPDECRRSWREEGE